ncbi:MAG: type II toxin-antitoxin system prevent-host-death family antitoxin [Kiritimatiellae bacterium]|nr:type II toxin-antitoxin system prevent-host-death family antitoxin [Kiritimatiellia bacterium]
MEATAKDLRFHSKELLESVERGEEVIITYHGKPRAKLVPINEDKPMVVKEESRLFGMWKDNDAAKDVNEYVRNLRKGRY